MSFVCYRDIESTTIDEKDYLKTGIKQFDKMCLGFGKSHLVIITGTRGGGKSSLLGQIELNFIDNGYRGLKYSLEMTNKRSKQWIVLQACGKENLKCETTITGKELYVPKTSFITQKICEWIGDKCQIDNNESYRFAVIKKNIEKKLEEDTSIDFVIIDNLFRMDIADFGNEKYLAQTRIAKELQELCQRKNVCLILVCHPNKVKTCPRIEDVGGSGDIINACDMCIIVHRVSNDFKYRAKDYFGWNDDNPLFEYDTLWEIAKDREFGEEGTMIGLYFEKESKRFLNFKGENKKYGWQNEGHQQQLIPIDPDDDLFNSLPF